MTSKYDLNNYESRLPESVTNFVENLFQKNSHMKVMQTGMSFWIEVVVGLIIGTAYTAYFFIPTVCARAGFDIVGSGFSVYNWWTNNGFDYVTKGIFPLADYAQIVASLYFIVVCVTNRNNYSQVEIFKAGDVVSII